MKIIKLQSENVKRLSAVEITPEGNTVVIGGKNGQGKSSVLDSIAYALGGTALIPDMPIRRGEQKARVVVETEDLVITRRWTSRGTELVVASKDGARYASPQKMLDDLVGRLSFDPLEFSRLKPAVQLATLRELVGLDTANLDEQHRGTYELRTQVNRELKALETRFEAMPHYADAPKEAVSVAELMAELKAAQNHNAQNDAAREEADRLINANYVAESAVKREVDALAELERAIGEVREKIARLQEEHTEAESRMNGAVASVKQLQDRDTATIEAKIESAEGINAKVAANAARVELSGELAAKDDQSQQLTEKLKHIAERKEQMLAAAKFPVDGLGVAESGITFGGIPFEQASAAEQLRVSVAIGLALNPKLKILLCRDGSLLDADSMRLLAEQAAAHDAQLWIERVSEDGAGCTVVIEDGAVVGVEAPEQAELQTA